MCTIYVSNFVSKSTRRIRKADNDLETKLRLDEPFDEFSSWHRLIITFK